MTRPTVLDMDLVVVPREPIREMWAAMADTLYRYKNRHHDKVVSDLLDAMLSASPYPTAWDEVRKAYDALEEELKWLRDNSVLIAVFNSAADRAEAAEARIAELEKRLADAEKIVKCMVDWENGMAPLSEDFRATRAYMEGK